MSAAELLARFDAMRDSGVCSPTTRELLDDAQQLISELLIGRSLRIELVGERDELRSRITAALAEMDRSMYGDPEVPFRMRHALNTSVEVF